MQINILGIIKHSWSDSKRPWFNMWVLALQTMQMVQKGENAV